MNHLLTRRAFSAGLAAGIPTILHGLMYSGAYTFPNIRCETVGVFTNTTPVDAYRGAGRPEATFLVERMMDKAASALNMDPVAIRRKNLIPPFENERMFPSVPSVPEFPVVVIVTDASAGAANAAAATAAELCAA